MERAKEHRPHPGRLERNPSYSRQVGHLKENPARGVDLPTLRTVKPKWVLTTLQARTLVDALPPLARTMVGVALLTNGPPARGVVRAALEGPGPCGRTVAGAGSRLRGRIRDAQDGCWYSG